MSPCPPLGAQLLCSLWAAEVRQQLGEGLQDLADLPGGFWRREGLKQEQGDPSTSSRGWHGNTAWPNCSPKKPVWSACSHSESASWSYLGATVLNLTAPEACIPLKVGPIFIAARWKNRPALVGGAPARGWKEMTLKVPSNQTIS